MPRIPLPAGFEGTENLPRTRRSLQNCFNNGADKVISRPGITELNDTGGVARGQFVWNGALYQVSSQSLIKITDTETGDFSTIGTIAGNEDIRTAVGFNTAVIVVNADNGAIYTLDKADTLVEISNNANFVACTAVAHINGRFVYIPFDGDVAFFSDVGAAGTVQGLSFFDAEELPDQNSTVFNFKNTLYVGGTDSFELFRDTGGTPNPFVRITGSRITSGFIGGLIQYNETFLFIGREEGQDFGIYAIDQGFAPKISNEAIDLVLSTYSQAQLATAIGGRIKWRGYDIATITLPFDSFGFFGGNWFVLRTLRNGRPSPWSGGFITQFNGKYYSAFSDKIGVFEKVNADYGEPITRIIDMGFEEPNNEWFACQSIEMGFSQGFNEAAGTVGIFLSRDNVTYGQPLFRDVDKIGNYANHLTWDYPGGMGAYDGFMGLRIYTTQDMDFSSDYLVLNFRG